MFVKSISALAAFLAAALLVVPPSAQAQLVAPTEPCRSMAHGKDNYIVCELDLRRHVLRTYWKRQDGKAYGSIWGLVRRLWTEGKRPLFAMNAGMFHKDRSPVGLYVEDGKVLVDADAANGEGNFYMKPNGVFFIAGDRAGVLETARGTRLLSFPEWV